MVQVDDEVRRGRVVGFAAPLFAQSTSRGYGSGPARLALALAVLVFCVLVLHSDTLAPLRQWPVDWVVPLNRWINWTIGRLSETPLLGGSTLKEIVRTSIPVFGAPIHAAGAVLYDGYALGFGSQRQEVIPPLSWLGLGLALILCGQRLGGSRLAFGSLLTVAFVLSFGLWQSAMVTLSQLVIAVPCSGLLGLFAGIAVHRHPGLRGGVFVALDLAQTVPIFSYLVPIIIFFGLGDVPSLIAIIIFAAPPMVRMTALGLAKAEAETGELATSIGCTPGQALWRVILPSASDDLRLGFSQVVMLSFSTVILTSLVGGGGLGYDVLSALQELALGRGLEAGLGITLLAIILDRFLVYLGPTSGRRAESAQAEGIGGRRASLPLIALVLLLGLTALGHFVPQLVHYPDTWVQSSAKLTDRAVDWMIDWTYDPLQAIQTILILHVFGPLKSVLLALPWVFVALAVFGLAWVAEGWRLAIGLSLPVTMIAVTGLWDKAVMTTFLCLGGVLVALAIGVPVGIVSGRVKVVRQVIRPVVDALQTLPAFIYLIPVVMLLGNGDLPCIAAIACFAVCPAIRYSEAAIRAVPAELVEASRQFGLTAWQRLLLVELPASRAHLLLAVSQTVLMALAMVVVTALIGSADLGHETIFAISKADPGQALVAGLAIASIGSVADRLLTAFANRSDRIERPEASLGVAS